MSCHRYAAKRDANEPEIVEAFKSGGANVARLSANGLPDLLVSFMGVLRLVEVKRGRAKLRASQEAFKAVWSDSPIYVVRTAPQARKWLKVWRERAERTRIVFPAGGTWAALEDHEDVTAERVRTEEP